MCSTRTVKNKPALAERAHYTNYVMYLYCRGDPPKTPDNSVYFSVHSTYIPRLRTKRTKQNLAGHSSARRDQANK